jgi:hypothetical protein
MLSAALLLACSAAVAMAFPCDGVSRALSSLFETFAVAQPDKLVETPIHMRHALPAATSENANLNG